MDLEAFSNPGFDAKSWINAASLQFDGENGTERCLADLEMKLQLVAEDVEAVLANSSTRALSNIPVAVLELSHVKGDVVSLKGDVKSLMDQLGDARGEALASVAALAQIELVKSRMEAAYDTLKEATELSALFLRVENVFASGDVPAIASTLATMRRSLILIGDVPEFRGGLQKLEVLEDRFQELVEGSLATAFVQRRGEVHQLVAMMESIGRSATVEKLYNTARLAPLQSYWDAFDPKAQSFASWIPGFYAEALAAAESEMHWLAAVLPGQSIKLATGLLEILFLRTDKSFRMRMSAALAQGSQKAFSPVAVLTQMQSIAVAFGHNLLQALSGAPQDILVKVVRAVYAPYEAQIARYGELEGKQLRLHMAAVILPDASAEDSEGVVAGLASSVSSAAHHVESAAQRCRKLTDFTEVKALLQVADEALIEYIERLQSSLHALRSHVLELNEPTTESRPTVENSVRFADVQPAEALQVSQESAALLPMLNVAGGLLAKLEVLDASLRVAVVDLGPAVDTFVAADAEPLHPARLRLTANQGAPLLQLRVFISSASDIRYQALPRALTSASAFQKAVNKLVYDVLMIMVKQQLEGVADQAVWRQAAPANEYNLPSFSASPSPNITAVGEYLMMLPTLLENVLTDGAESTDDESQVDGEWLDKVAVGAACLYVQQLERIERFSPPGSQQLAADMEYFCNVLAALSVALPTEFISWQTKHRQGVQIVGKE